MDSNIILPKVSVIMPVYNNEAYISEAINSVIDQTYNNWELIIINDGSTDSTEKVVFELLTKDERIQYYYQENGKQGKARNLGISKSKGTYLAFLDADDLWLPEKLEIQIKEIQEKNVDLVFSDSYIFHNKESFDVSKRMNVFSNVFYNSDSIKLFLIENRIPILTVLVRRDRVIEVGGFSEEIDIVEDYHLWLKLLISKCVFYSLDYILAKYRVHDDSVTASDKLVLDKIPNVFFDLLVHYPFYQKELEEELKLKFKLIYKRNLFKKNELSFWIKKNTKYLSKSYLNFFYLFLNFLFPTRVTKRALIYILNA